MKPGVLQEVGIHYCVPVNRLHRPNKIYWHGVYIMPHTIEFQKIFFNHNFF